MEILCTSRISLNKEKEECIFIRVKREDQNRLKRLY